MSKEGLTKTRYFTGKPCKNGHVAERFIDTKECVGCKSERDARRRWAKMKTHKGIRISVPHEQLALIESAADEIGLRVSEFVLVASLSEARKIVEIEPELERERSEHRTAEQDAKQDEESEV